ncbi:MAG: LysR family transcriptional regulator [Crocinitomicaceae bacterium]|nr:LysR family transcriptional regulator [Crocinitomicaceae bacterium]
MKYKVKCSIWIEGDEGAFIGPGRIDLLENIRIEGSISKAAKAMKMSYRQAWELVDSMNKQSKNPLVVKTSGGAGGGGTLLTDEGIKMIKLFKKLQENFQKFNEDQSKKWLP